MDPPTHLQQHLMDMGVLEPTKSKLPDVVGTKVGTVDKFRDPRDPVTGEVPF